MLLRLVRWFRGTLEIRIENGIAERFLSVCGRKKIVLWNMKPGKTVTASMLASDFKRVREVTSKSGTKIKIIRRKGLPFLLLRYRKRKLFAVGILVFILLLFFLTSLIWTVRVDGIQKTDLIAFNRILKENGVKKWAWSYGVDEEKLKFELMQQLDTVSWVGITIKGTEVSIIVKEREQSPQMLPADQPCHLVARRDGVVELLLVKEGETVVKIGETVTKGQLLVSALKGLDVQTPVPVHAFGEVIARTWTKKELVQPLVLKKKELTGQEKSRYGVKISKFFINFFRNTGNLYPECDTIEETLWKAGEFALVKRTLREVKLTEQTMNEAEAIQFAEETMRKELADSFPQGTELVSVQSKVIASDEKKITVECMFECLENIAEQKAYEPELQGETEHDTKIGNSEQS